MYQNFIFLLSSPKDVFLDESKIAFFAFKIRTGEYILCSFGLCVPKFYFQLNMKWHCLHLKGISDPLKPLNLISNLFKPKIAFFAFEIRAGEYILIWFVRTKVLFAIEFKMQRMQF